MPKRRDQKAVSKNPKQTYPIPLNPEFAAVVVSYVQRPVPIIFQLFKLLLMIEGVKKYVKYFIFFCIFWLIILFASSSVSWNKEGIMEDVININLLYAYSYPLIALAIGLEMLFSYLAEKEQYSTQDTLVSIIFGALANIGEFVCKSFILSILNYFFSIKIIAWEVGSIYWITLLFLIDFIYYWCHYFEHKVRILWVSHLTHHSSSNFNIAIGLRGSIFKAFYRYWLFLPLTLIGYAPLHILLFYSFIQLYAVFLHTKNIKKLGMFEFFFVTPSHHRVHHASNSIYLDKNFGAMFIIWDRLFFTFKDEDPSNPIVYGLTTPIVSENPLDVPLIEIKKLKEDASQPNISWIDRFRYVFGKPGWKHKKMV